MSKKTKSFQMSHISIQCLARTLIRNCWMIVAAALVALMTTSLLLTWFHVPKYQANMTYAVNSRTTSYISSGNLTSTREVASVLSELLGTELIHEGIRKSDSRLENFNGTITAKQVGGTNFIVVTATAGTPEQAFLALDSLKEVFPEVAGYIASRNVLNVMRDPALSPLPSNRIDTQKVSRIAGLVGAVLMASVLCYFSIRSETIQTRTGARHLLDAPIIATVGHEVKNRTFKTLLKRSTKQVRVFSPTTSFAYTEQISNICSQMEHESEARGRKVFLITGVGENEGKSTVSGNVSSALALKGHKVAVVDCDLRKPAQNRFFGGAYSTDLPLNRMLAQPFSRENLEQCMLKHEQLGLYMLFPMNSDSRCTELVSGETMTMLLRELEKEFDFVIVDSPPMGMFTDTEIMADKVDATMLVVRQDYTAACDVNDAIDILRKCKASFIGCILNDMMGSFRSQYGYGSKYGGGSRYGHDGKYAYGEQSKTGGLDAESRGTERKGM